MSLTRPLSFKDETTFENKLMYKGLAYLLVADNAGERHEVSPLYDLHRGMVINGKEFKVTSPGDFSRSALPSARITEDIGTKTAQWFKDRADRFLPALAQDTKLQYGVNEIDSFATASDGTQAFVECKSGSAKSGGTQTSSYMQISTELAVTSGNPDTKADALITWHNTTYGTTLASGTALARVASLNAILNQQFGIQVLDTHISKSVDRAVIIGYLAKLFPETTGWYDTSKQQSFWMQVFKEALS